MATAYGIFNDEGMIDGPFYTKDEADTWAADYDEDEGAVVYELCPDHEEQPAHACELCYDEED